jgi:hypothetical protein
MFLQGQKHQKMEIVDGGWQPTDIPQPSMTAMTLIAKAHPSAPLRKQYFTRVYFDLQDRNSLNLFDLTFVEAQCMARFEAPIDYYAEIFEIVETMLSSLEVSHEVLDEINLD